MKLVKGLIKLGLVLIIVGLVAGATTKHMINKYSFAEKKESTTMNDLEREIQKYKNEEAELLERKEELKKLPDPEIVMKQLQTNGKILAYESNVIYSDYILEKTFLGSRELLLELNYKFGISMDLANIEIVSIEDLGGFDGIQVTVRVPKDKLQIEYVSLLADKSKLDDDTKFFATKFKSEDYKAILENAETSIRDSTVANDEIWYKAHEKVKSEIAILLDNIDEASDDIDFTSIQFVE